MIMMRVPTSRLFAFSYSRRTLPFSPISHVHSTTVAARTIMASSFRSSSSSSSSSSSPRKFPTSGFVTLDPKLKVEEEGLPSYVAGDYYPVAMGEVFASRYQVVSKLGFGVSSTVWLCQDLLLVAKYLFIYFPRCWARVYFF